ncbi:LysR family transcriptional regulator [Sphingobium sp. DEHP117]|uniref:LysR family transcriptional regulator n=1 Tax=Sphingobium sp. DEHP117 TaxID=2993436 RepID=UPI0027D701AA|nr:LysR substrate-binding domain-containing protein [Sphingobium sp. DEHP117]MDQ4419089.1 LysR family transcriptional regulator [Sphingobium sp. DEHP117]
MSNWAGIEEFVAVAQAGSFGGGARALGVSPTHVSRSIMALERRVQALLFHRTTRTVRLTDTGRVFLEYCERIIRERDEAIALINEQGEPHGDLRVTCSTAMGERFIAPILRDMAMLYPQLSISINLSNRVVDLIAEGFDLAIRTGNLADSRLIATRVASRTLYTCASPAYLAEASPLRTVQDLAQHNCLEGSSSTWRFRVDGKDIIHRPKGRFRCNSGYAVMEACLAGMGVCQLPEFYVLPHLDSGKVAVVLSDYQTNDEPIWAVYPQHRHLLPKIRLVIERLRQELGEVIKRPTEIF